MAAVIIATPPRQDYPPMVTKIGLTEARGHLLETGRTPDPISTSTIRRGVLPFGHHCPEADAGRLVAGFGL